VAAAASAASAQAPVVNARVERRTVAQGLAREIQTTVDRGAATWIGYSVPILRRADGALRSTEWCCGRCRLEPPTQLVVLARAEARTLVDVRSLSVDCDVDAGGMPLVWFDGVNADESVAWLTSMVQGAPSTQPLDRMANAALSALAQHAAPAAAAPLVTLARSGGTTQMRTRALSLLAQRAADEAMPAITAAIDQDPDKEVRRQAVASLSRIRGGAGIPRLMELARTHKDPEVRRQAMLSLGQSRDPRAVDFFAQILLK
jgi:HEAT repeat protein